MFINEVEEKGLFNGRGEGGDGMREKRVKEKVISFCVCVCVD